MSLPKNPLAGAGENNGLKWVRATDDNLPEKLNKRLSVMVDGEPTGMMDYDVICLYKHKNIEWLSPSLSPVNEEREKEVEGLRNVDDILLDYAKRNNLYVDFSDKEYGGDKVNPMDRIGLLDYICGQKNGGEELALYETRIALNEVIKILGTKELSPKHKERLYAAKRIYNKYFKIEDILRESTPIDTIDNRIKELEEALRLSEDYINSIAPHGEDEKAVLKSIEQALKQTK